MKRLLLVALTSLLLLPALAQKQKFGGDYYDCRLAAHQKEGMTRGAIVWLGDSLTEQGWWDYLSREKGIANRGIGGDNTYGMLNRLPEILEFSPRKIFFMGGVNDLSAGYSVEEIYENIRQIIEMIRERVPACEIYIQSVITPNDKVLAYSYIKGKQAQMRDLNQRLEALCSTGVATWVDLTSILHNQEGELREELTKDGIHLHPEAYFLWAGYLKKMNYLRK